MTIEELRALLEKATGVRVSIKQQDVARRRLLDHLPALLAVAEAAAVREREGCNDTCDHELNPKLTCSCGDQELHDALAALEATR